MGDAPRRRLLLGVCAALMAIAVANAASGEGPASAVVVGQAKCADCTRKNMNAEAAFKGLKVAIKCKNGNGEYESKVVGELDGSGAFSVPLAADLHGADCLAQLHSAAGAPCPGQEPSMIVPQSEGTFVATAGEEPHPSPECASVTFIGPIKKHFMDHFHKKPEPPKPKPGSEPPKPKPEPKPEPGYHHHHFFDHFHKKPEPPKPKPGTEPPKPKPEPEPKYHHPFFDHFHKKPVPPKPEPEPEPQPTPTYTSPTPIYHPPAEH
ncbi:hypothetical protein ACP4OV_003542 [Aristida adscensionis]